MTARSRARCRVRRRSLRWRAHRISSRVRQGRSRGTGTRRPAAADRSRSPADREDARAVDRRRGRQTVDSCICRSGSSACRTRLVAIRCRTVASIRIGPSSGSPSGPRRRPRDRETGPRRSEPLIRAIGPRFPSRSDGPREGASVPRGGGRLSGVIDQARRGAPERQQSPNRRPSPHMRLCLSDRSESAAAAEAETRIRGAPRTGLLD